MLSLLSNMRSEGAPEPQTPNAQTSATAPERVATRMQSPSRPIMFGRQRERERFREKNRGSSKRRAKKKMRKKQEQIEMWRIATINLNGASSNGRIQGLKNELNERAIDVAFLQETLYEDRADQIRGYTIYNTGRGTKHPRRTKWGAAVALHQTLTPRVEKINREDGAIIRVTLGRMKTAPWGAGKKCHMIGVYIPNNPQEAENTWNSLFRQLAKIPEEDAVIIGGDFNAHIHGSRYVPQRAPPSQKPTTAIGPYFTYDHLENESGTQMKRFMQANALYSPLTWNNPKTNESVRPTHYSYNPAIEGRILDHILIPWRLQPRVNKCVVDDEWTSSPDNPYDHRGVILTMTPQYPNKAKNAERRIDERQVQKEIAQMMRADSEKMRRAGDKIERNESEFPDIVRAHIKRREYNAHIEHELQQQSEDNTSAEAISKAIQNAATKTYGEQAKAAIKQKHNMRMQPWDRSEQTKQLHQERRAAHGQLISMHKQIAKCHRQRQAEPTAERRNALQEAQYERDSILRRYKEQTKALRQARHQDFNDFLKQEAEKIEQEDGETHHYTRAWQFVKKWGKNTRMKAREEIAKINGKETPKDQAEEFSKYLEQTQGVPAPEAARTGTRLTPSARYGLGGGGGGLSNATNHSSTSQDRERGTSGSGMASTGSTVTRGARGGQVGDRREAGQARLSARSTPAAEAASTGTRIPPSARYGLGGGGSGPGALSQKVPTECHEYLAQRPTRQEVMNAIDGLNNKKALDVENLGAEHYKHLTSQNRQQIIDLVQNTWESEQVAPAWGKTLVVHIPKPGKDHTSPTGYRPISLITIQAKIMLRVITARMTKTTAIVTQETQHGFKPGLSCEHAIGAVNHFLQDTSTKSIVAFLDLKKAFDMISQKKLYHILQVWGYPNKLIRIITHLHDAATLIPKHRGAEGTAVPQKRGVWQGSALSPILFILYVAGMMTEYDHRLSRHPGRPKAYRPTAIREAGRFQEEYLSILDELLEEPDAARSIMYADDTAILAESPQDMKIALDTYTTLCAEYALEMSSDKCVLLHNHESFTPLRYMDMKEERAVKYLGVWIQAKGKATHTVYDRIRKALNAYYDLYKRVYANPHVEEEVKVIVFKATILPILTYGLASFNLSDHNMSMIESKWDSLNKRLYRDMNKPEIAPDIWQAYKGYHRSELQSPNIIEWIQAKRLRALYKAVEPSLHLIQDPNREVEQRHTDINYSPIPWYYKILLYGIDPQRDRDRIGDYHRRTHRSQKYHPTMRHVLRKDQESMKGKWQEYAEFQRQMVPQPQDTQPWPYEEKYKKSHTPPQRQWLREQQAIAVAQRKRVEVMNEWDNVIRCQQESGSQSWQYIKKPSVFYTLITPHKERREAPPREWRCPKEGCNKQYNDWLNLQRHLFSQISHETSIQDPRASPCYIQLPGDNVQARARIEQYGPLQPPTTKCPFGVKTCKNRPRAKVQTCKFCQNQHKSISEKAKIDYPRHSAYLKKLRKRK